jgi:hypothetical protein
VDFGKEKIDEGKKMGKKSLEILLGKWIRSQIRSSVFEIITHNFGIVTNKFRIVTDYFGSPPTPSFDRSAKPKKKKLKVRAAIATMRKHSKFQSPQKRFRYDSEIVRYDSELVRYDPEIVRYHRENTGTLDE